MRAILVMAAVSALLAACSTHEPAPVPRSDGQVEDCLRPSGEEETDGGVGGTGNTLEPCADAGTGRMR